MFNLKNKYSKLVLALLSTLLFIPSAFAFRPCLLNTRCEMQYDLGDAVLSFPVQKNQEYSCTFDVME